MSFIVTNGVTAFNGRKGRKLLCPLRVTITFDLPPAPAGPCVLQVSIPPGGGPFSVQPIPNVWNAVSATMVQSVQTFTGNPTVTLTAFAAYFFADDFLPGTRQDSATFTITVFDPASTTNPTPFSGAYTITVTAQPALNKHCVFVLDRTANMGLTSASGITRLQRLKNAVTRGLALFTANDQVGIVRLDNKPDVQPPVAGALLLMPLAAADATGKGKALFETNNLAVDAGLPARRVYSAGIDTARNQDPTATILLITDGTSRNTVFPGTVQVVPASALFLETPTSGQAPNVCSPLPGAYAISASVPDTGEFMIEKLLSQILIELGGNAVVSDPDGSLGPDETLTFPLNLNETDRGLELYVFSEQPELLEVDYVPPRSEHRPHDPHSGYGHQPQDPHSGYGHQPQVCDDDNEPELRGVKVRRIKLPAITPDTPDRGLGHSVTVRRPRIRGGDHDERVGFTFLAAVQSDLVLDAYAVPSQPEVGAELLFSARLIEYGLTVRDRKNLSVHVEIRHPDGEIERLPLNECAPGRFEVSRRAFRPGTYTAHFVAIGRTLLRQRPFRREALRCIVVFEPGTTDHCC